MHNLTQCALLHAKIGGAEVLEDFFKPALEVQWTSPNIILFDHIKRAVVDIPYPMSRGLDLSNDEHREEFPHCLVEIRNTVYASYISCEFCGLFTDLDKKYTSAALFSDYLLSTNPFGGDRPIILPFLSIPYPQANHQQQNRFEVLDQAPLPGNYRHNPRPSRSFNATRPTAQAAGGHFHTARQFRTPPRTPLSSSAFSPPPTPSSSVMDGCMNTQTRIVGPSWLYHRDDQEIELKECKTCNYFMDDAIFEAHVCPIIVSAQAPVERE
ncbi:hypothetical protein M422DRAFT_264660 [Sphaerobolus stellatus SS14]|uniref:Uncharacterized protein n=1 Tax=Sphaerobolus stellatus (strain SS14) TaxID=990650 RepID=A0A0C9UF83_SPHS4|nr:hypothetical protein M422DRAFT_264660 [Sphaerobolus stellatus SS14]